MSGFSFDPDTEAMLLRDYIQILPLDLSSHEQERLRRACLTFRALHPGESCLGVTHSTAWLPSWALTVPCQSDRVAQVQALGRWWSWLFDRAILDSNVLASFYPNAQSLRETPLVLCHNLQRLIARYLDDHGCRQRDSQRKLRRRLENFNLFLHRQVPAWNGQVSDEGAVLDWLRQCSGGSSRMLGLLAGTVSGFLDYLVEAGRLPASPFDALKARYGHRRIGDIVATELGRPGYSLTPVVPQPRFCSRMAERLEAYVSLKRAMGLRYEAAVGDLQRFDQFVASLTAAPAVVTPELVRLWMVSGRHLSSETRKRRLGLVRQFSTYLARTHPESYIPDRFAFPANGPAFKAYIYSPHEYRALLRASLALPGPRSTLRPKTFYTALLLLYATGLRIGEALRLRLRDVDLDARSLVIRDTKFHKSRIVPFSASLAAALRAYLDERLVAAAGPDAPLFINHRRRPYSVDKFSEVFRTLLVAAGVPSAPRRHRPRAYDVRHTFAVSRVLQWYREGANVAAKLPLLATYMGHVDVLSTQVYLNSTAELLREASDRFEQAFGGLIPAAPEVSHEVR